MRMRSWYWLVNDDNAKGWHAADIGEWSLTVGGAGCQSVKRTYRGPWWVHFGPDENASNVVEDGPFKTLTAAKKACIRLAKERMGEMMKALEGVK